MADIDLKTLTPDTSIADSAVLFGADSQASATPSVYSVATLRTHIVGTANTFTQPQVVSVGSSSDALRITQTGAGNALLVEDSANPDSTPFVIDQSGNVVVGATSVPTSFNIWTGGNLGTKTSFTGDSAADGSLLLRVSVGSTASPYINLVKSRGTNASPTVVSSGDFTGAFVFQGFDGANNIPSAYILSAIDGTPGTNDMPGRLVFSTTADGASSPTERMRITNSGNVGIGTSAPGERLHVSSGAAEFAIQWDSTGSKSWVLASATNRAYIRNKTDSIEAISIYNGGTVYFSGSVLIGAASARTIAGQVPELSLERAGAARSAVVRNSNDANGPIFFTAKSRGAATGSFTIVASGDALGTWNFAGADGAADIIAAQIRADVDGTPGLNDMPGRLVFSTTADGASTPLERMRITSAGNILIGTDLSPTTGTQCLTVETGTAPTATPADTISVYSSDLSAGNTMLSIYTEGTSVNANTTAAATHRIAVRINGTVYYLLANTAA